MEVENALVSQKDEILKQVNAGQWEKALDNLSFVERLWRAMDYGYKVVEIRQRIRREIDDRLATADHWKTKEKLSLLRLRTV